MNYSLRPICYTVAGARAVSGIGTTRLYELLGAGVLEARKAGRSTLILADSLHRYVDSLPAAKITTRAKAAA